MKIRCMREVLNDAMNDASHAVAKRSTLAVLENILLKAKSDELTVTATNLQTAIRARIIAEVEREGSVTVPAKTFNDLVGTLTGDTVDLELDERTLSLAIACGDTKSHIKGTNAEEFPIIPLPESDPLVTMETDTLTKLVKSGILSVSSDESRPMLTGVYCEFVGGNIKMTSADGFRLSSAKKPSSDADVDVTALVPGDTLTHLMRMKKMSEVVDIHIENKRVYFVGDKRTVVGQLLDLQFPNYEAIIPEVHDTRVTVDRRGLLDACQTARIFSREAAGIVRFQIGDGHIVVDGRSDEAGETSSIVEASIDGDAVEIAFNVGYVIDVLKAMNGNDVVMEFSGPSQPGAWIENDVVHVIMPMHQGKGGEKDN